MCLLGKIKVGEVRYLKQYKTGWCIKKKSIFSKALKLRSVQRFVSSLINMDALLSQLKLIADVCIVADSGFFKDF